MSKRLFLAIPLSEEIKNILSEKKKEIDPDLKWIPGENLHITIHFLGNVEQELIPQLIQKMAGVVQSFNAFQLLTKEIATQSGKFQKMVWVKFINAPEFVELSQRIAKALEVTLTRKPLPHINLIRVKDTHYFLNNPSLPVILNKEIMVDKVELWESELRPGKFPVYSCLYKFKLNENTKK